MATLARLDVILGLQMRGFQRNLDRAQFKLRKLGRKLDQTGRTLSTRLTVPLALAGAAAVKMAVDYEKSLSKVIGLVGVAETQVAAWSKELLELGPALGKSPKELADGMFFITSAGLKGQAALEALTASAQASAAGLGETATVADAVTSAINSYGEANIDAAQAAAVLVATVKEGKASAEELTPVLGRILPVAAELGVQFHEVGAAIAAMTRVGAKADEAATSLKSLMVGIIKPASQSREQIEKMGLSVDGLRKTIRQKGILAALALLAEKMEGNLDALGAVFPNQRALTAVLNATGVAAEATAGIYARMAKVTKEVLAEAFRVAAETADFKLNAALSRLQATLIRIGDVILPRLLPMVDSLTKMIEAAGKRFSELDESTQGMILGVVAFAAVIGPLLVGLGGIALLLGGLSLSMAGWTAAVVAGGLLIVKNWEAVKGAVAGFIDFATPALKKFSELLGSLWIQVRDSAARIWPDVQRIFQNVVDTMVGLWIEHGDTIKKAWALTVGIIKTGLGLILGVVEAVAAFLTGDASRAWGILKDAVGKAVDVMVRISAAGWLNMEAAILDWRANTLKSINEVIGKYAALAKAYLALPFLNPVARAAGEKGLEILGGLMLNMAEAAGASRDRADELRKKAELLLKPITDANHGLVEMQGAWVEVKGAAIDAGEATVKAVDEAGTEVQRKLAGGFGKGIEDGVERGKIAISNMVAEIEATPVKITFDVEDLQRAAAEAAGKPDTGGSLGV